MIGSPVVATVLLPPGQYQIQKRDSYSGYTGCCRFELAIRGCRRSKNRSPDPCSNLRRFLAESEEFGSQCDYSRREDCRAWNGTYPSDALARLFHEHSWADRE